MSDIGAVQIRVTPEVLNAQAETVRNLAKNMKKHFTAIETQINKTNSYWIGEAGDIHRQLYKEQKDDIDKMLRRLLEHPDELEMMAQNYKTAEGANVIRTQFLPADVIE